MPTRSPTAAHTSTVVAGFAIVLVACGGPADDGAGAELDAVATLAKAGGWRTGPPPDVHHVFAVVEIAYDEDAATRAWEDNVPDGLPDGAGDPDGPGLHGSLDDVDLDRQALVVWSAGESGTCPEWLADITTSDGVVEVQRGSGTDPGAMCIADYIPYRMVLAVDRDRLPARDELPIDDIEGLPTGRVDAYPEDG